MKKPILGVVGILVFCTTLGLAQNAGVAAKLGHPQMILYNGKIVTMDDSSFESRVGTIVQAMAIRDSRILATGTNTDIQPLAGPQTKSVDLKGKTVLPSFFLTHEHPTDWAFQEPRAITRVLPNDDVVIHRWMPNRPPKEQLALFEPMMREALAKAKPGQWILLSFYWGPNYEWSKEMMVLFRDSIRKEYLDQLAPSNPVKVKNGFITSVVNQLGLDEEKKVHPNLAALHLPSAPDVPSKRRERLAPHTRI